MTKTQNTENTECRGECGATEMAIHCLQKKIKVNPLPFRIRFGGLLWNWSQSLSCDPSITRVSIYPSELKTYAHSKSCTWVLYSFIHNCKLLEATNMSYNWWTDKLWDILKIQYCSAMKGNKLSSDERHGEDLNVYY